MSTASIFFQYHIKHPLHFFENTNIPKFFVWVSPIEKFNWKIVDQQDRSYYVVCFKNNLKIFSKSSSYDPILFSLTTSRFSGVFCTFWWSIHNTYKYLILLDFYLMFVNRYIANIYKNTFFSLHHYFYYIMFINHEIDEITLSIAFQLSGTLPRWK